MGRIRKGVYWPGAVVVAGLGISMLAAVPSAAAGHPQRPVRAVAGTAAQRQQLRRLYAAHQHLPITAVGQVRPGAVRLAQVRRTGQEWALSYFSPSAQASTAAKVTFQEGAATALFTRVAGHRWRLAVLGSDLRCGTTRVPIAVQRFWHLTRLAHCPALPPQPQRRAKLAPLTATTQGIASTALNLLGVSTNPVSTTFASNGGYDCNPFTGIEATWVSDVETDGTMCGQDSTDFSSTIQDRTEYWCSDFAKYVWTAAGVTTDVATLTPLSSSFYKWGVDQGDSMPLDGSNAAVGDAIVFYPPSQEMSNTQANLEADGLHVAIVTKVYANGNIDAANGDIQWDGSLNIKVYETSDLSPQTMANDLEGALYPSGQNVQWAFVSPGVSSGAPAVPLSPATGSDSSGNLYTFWKGTDGDLWEDNFSASSDSWTGAHKVGNGMGPLGSQPTVAVSGTGNQFVFWEGTNGYLYEAYYDGDGSWHGPTKVTDQNGSTMGSMGSAPAAGVQGNTTVYVFWRNSSDQGLQEASGNGESPLSFGTGQHEVGTMGPLGSVPTVAVSSTGNQFVFWEGTTGYLWEAYYDGDGSWHGPTKVTDQNGSTMGSMGSAPTAGINGATTVYVFWQNSGDGGLQEASGNGESPLHFGTGQHEITGMGSLGSAPTVGVDSAGDQYVFWKGTNNADLWMTWWSSIDGWLTPPLDLGAGPLG